MYARKGAYYIDTTPSVKEAFVEESLCVFLHFSAVPEALVSLPDTKRLNWEGPNPEEKGGSVGAGEGGG